MAFLHLDGGQQAARVLIDGVECWVGRARNGRILKRIFATQAQALLAGDDEIEASAAPDVEVEAFEVLVVQSHEGEGFALLWDHIDKRVWEDLYRHDAQDSTSIRDLQEVLSSIDLREEPKNRSPC